MNLANKVRQHGKCTLLQGWLLITGLLLASNLFAAGAQQGVLDAFSWDPRKHPLQLSGEWGFEWQTLQPGDLWYPPRPPWFEMPSTWDSGGTAGWNYPGRGYATFTLRVANLSERYDYAILIPEVSTSYRLFANGRLVSEGGNVSDRAEHGEPYNGNHLARIPAPDQGQLRLILQVANFDHHSGGPWQSLELGIRDDMANRYFSSMVYEAVIAALMVVMAILLVLEYFVDPKDRSGLWLGLFALALGVRLGISGYAPFYWMLDGHLPWSWHMTLAYITMLISPVFFLGWMHASFPYDLARRSAQLLSFPYLICALLCLLLPPRYFTMLLTFFSVMVMLMVALGAFFLVLISWRRRHGSLLLMLGVISLGVTVVHDVMLNNQLIGGAPWIAMGLLIFILSQTSNFLSLRVMQRRQIEFLSKELSRANHELEDRVELRTRDLAEKAQALERANNQLQVLANVDGLTGLLNRRAFIEQMKQLSELPVKVALLWIDIDHFKGINDTYGHAAGDLVLKRMGHLLRNLGRDQDRSGRLGGEEFALLLLDCDESGAEQYAQRLQMAMKQMTFEHWPELKDISASIGIAIGRLGEDSWEELIRNADEAMYHVKRHGRDGYRFS